MSKKKPTPGGRFKKNTAVSLARSSAAEYLTFVAAGGDSEASVEMRYEDETSVDAEDDGRALRCLHPGHQPAPEANFQWLSNT